MEITGKAKKIFDLAAFNMKKVPAKQISSGQLMLGNIFAMAEICLYSTLQ
jgi:hypothetical protein